MDQISKLIDISLKPKIEKEEVKKQKSELAKLASGFGEKFKETFSKKSVEVGKNLASSLIGAFDTATKWFSNQFKGAWKELNNMVSSSYLTNPTTRQNAFTYGMSASESYGFEQAKSMMGISEDDLMYMEPHQAQKFQEIMTKYSEKYSELYDSGFFEEMMDYQIEMKEFEQDIKLEFVEWMIDNKDLIKTAMNTILDISKFLLEALSAIVRFLGGDVTSYSDSTVNNSNITTNNSINVDNTFNGTNSADQTNMSNPGLMTYEQVLSILN